MPEVSTYKHGQFCWVDLVAIQLDVAINFYEQLFGWQSQLLDTQGGPKYLQFTLDGKIVAGIGQMNEEMIEEGLPSMWNSYVNVKDVGDAVDALLEHGATITVPAQDILDYGSLAFFQDPTGGMLGLWEGGSHFGSEVINDPGCFCFNELATRDIDRAGDFFAKVFGWTYRDNPHSPAPYKIIECEGEINGGLLQMTEEWGDVSPMWTVYFNTADIEAAAERVKSLGGEVCHGPFETPVGMLAIIRDPQGASFNLISLKQQLD